MSILYLIVERAWGKVTCGWGFLRWRSPSSGRGQPSHLADRSAARKVGYRLKAVSARLVDVERL